MVLHRFTVKNCLLVVFVFILGKTSAIYGATFLEYSHSEGDKWHIISEVDEEVFIDGEFLNKTKILNKISVEVRLGDGKDGRLYNHYQIAEKLSGSEVYGWMGEYEAEYNRDRLGRLSGFDGIRGVPTVRDLPVFPQKALEPGDVWSAEGTELFDWEPRFEIPGILPISFLAEYRYVGPVDRDGREYHEIEIAYGYIWQLEASSETGRYLSDYAFFPVEIVGEFHQTVLFDLQAGRNLASSGDFEYSYRLNTGEVQTFRGTSRGNAVYTSPLDRENLVREIEELDDLSAQVVDEGVSFILEDINFVPDQPVMLPGQEDKLSRIGKILARYPDRDILVVGHSARIGNQNGGVLSKQRADTVAQYFIDIGVRLPRQVITRGMGYTQPIGDNSTEAGRRKNRRVEIIILEN